ncbi:mRNA transport regulator MTR2 [Spathaspora passalidarum NRRL Y-27907]|uniref:mRNA transport regulator MTR2 n=1 Tax=Spathaspora passalidarum (strain NRRL Y-27907 / 11-Y1) TaxID=619300 RepID=G3ALU2_SPAPN|nr:mRNA transport regulator MTR2 [Spathaspora passalidarum NRRL Y-27907]EGW32701.1 mRNA transport regulator MTR2 [Spathaspora passalidarum NRRL Y-27907]
MNQQDPTQPIEPFLKDLLASLDAQYASPTQSFPNVEAYATQFASNVKRDCAIIVNGKPIIPTPQEDARLQFQKKWLATPLSSHQLTSFDCHLIPGTGTFIVNFCAKVKFDQSGRNRLGESADLITDNSIGRTVRPIWGSNFGLNVNLVVDESVINNSKGEIISSLNYRFTYIPEDTILKI